MLSEVKNGRNIYALMNFMEKLSDTIDENREPFIGPLK